MFSYCSHEHSDLASHPQWLQLLGYQHPEKSSILNSDFFLSSEGNVSPFSELQATLIAFKKKDHKALCKYRGRYAWLQQQNALPAGNTADITCPDFERFLNAHGSSSTLKKNTSLLRQQTSHSVSLIFASGYLGNPASYYGHLLIKLNNTHDLTSETSLQEIAVNYGAKIPEEDGIATYILKGLTGVYPSRFTPKEFYYHLHLYADTELRDLWEYRLQLTQDDYELLVGHLWEMLNATHGYYFANRNCAYRVAELIQLITDKRLVERSAPWVAPQSVIQNLSLATRNAQPLLQTINYYPSRQSLLYQKYNQLTPQEKAEVKRKTTSFTERNFQKKLDHSSTANFEPASKKRILDTLQEYYRVIYASEDVTARPEYQQTMRERFTLPLGKPNFLLDTPERPDMAHKPSYINTGLAIKEGHAQAKLNIRPAYYDELDSSPGHVKASALSMLEATLHASEDSITLKDLTLIHILQANSRSTGLPGDENNAWLIHAGATTVNNDCDDCLEYLVYGGKGYSWSTDSDRLHTTLLGQAGALGRSSFTESLFAGAHLNTSYYISSKLSAGFKLTQRHFLKRGDDQTITQLNARYRLSADLDTRLSIKHTAATEITLSVGYYW